MGSPLSQPPSQVSNMKIQYPSLPMILRVGCFSFYQIPSFKGNNKKRWNGTAMGVEFAGLGDEVLAACSWYTSQVVKDLLNQLLPCKWMNPANLINRFFLSISSIHSTTLFFFFWGGGAFYKRVALQGFLS